MKAIIEQINKYKVTINGKTFTDFSKREEWQGMIKFSGPSGTLIVDNCQTNFDDVFESLFNLGRTDDHKPVEMIIVKASPDLIT